MAMTTCAECSAALSDQAPTCPNCGAPSPAKAATSQQWRIGLGITASLVAFVVAALAINWFVGQLA